MRRLARPVLREDLADEAGRKRRDVRDDVGLLLGDVRRGERAVGDEGREVHRDDDDGDDGVVRRVDVDGAVKREAYLCMSESRLNTCKGTTHRVADDARVQTPASAILYETRASIIAFQPEREK